jgi:hypothetical protein
MIKLKQNKEKKNPGEKIANTRMMIKLKKINK